MGCIEARLRRWGGWAEDPAAILAAAPRTTPTALGMVWVILRL